VLARLEQRQRIGAVPAVICLDAGFAFETARKIALCPTPTVSAGVNKYPPRNVRVHAVRQAF
jgi:hypothetical protein